MKANKNQYQKLPHTFDRIVDKEGKKVEPFKASGTGIVFFKPVKEELDFSISGKEMAAAMAAAMSRR